MCASIGKTISHTCIGKPFLENCEEFSSFLYLFSWKTSCTKGLFCVNSQRKVEVETEIEVGRVDRAKMQI